MDRANDSGGDGSEKAPAMTQEAIAELARVIRDTDDPGAELAHQYATALHAAGYSRAPVGELDAAARNVTALQNMLGDASRALREIVEATKYVENSYARDANRIASKALAEVGPKPPGEALATPPARDLLPDPRALLDKAAKQFRFYEQQHLAKKTPEAYEKSKVNGALAHEIECYLGVTEATTTARDDVLSKVETLESIVAWGDETFGPCSQERAIERASEEWDEMEEPGADVSIEAADVMICLLRIPGILGAINR